MDRIHSTDWGSYIEETIILNDGVAFCHLSFPGKDDPPVHRKRAWLHELTVLPEYRNLGLATKLIGICKERAKADGRKWLSLWVKPGTWMEEWYKRLGFVYDEDFMRGDGQKVYNMTL